MRKSIAALLIGFWLVACATIPNPVNNNRLAAIESSYGIALSAAVAYRNTRLCKKGEIVTITNVCAHRSVILKLQAADRQVQIALSNARHFVKDNPQVDAFNLLNAAQQALNSFNIILDTYMVR